MSRPTRAELQAALKYDPGTGTFTWLVARSKRRVGIIAGSIHDAKNGKGYVRIRLNGRHYFAHRLAWLYMTGSWPARQVDHRDTDKGNNRWSNLRLADNSQNHANRGAQANNTNGYKGVSWAAREGKWDARIKVRGRQVCLGLFDTAVAAHAAYQVAAREHHGEFARTA